MLKKYSLIFLVFLYSHFIGFGKCLTDDFNLACEIWTRDSGTYKDSNARSTCITLCANGSSLTTDLNLQSTACLTTNFEDSDGWENHNGGNWTEYANSGIYTSGGIYANSGSANSGSRKIGFNDVGDWFELPSVDNPTSLEYYASLSSAPTSNNSIKVQYYYNSSWHDIAEHTATSTSYQLFTADLSSISALTNVRLRLYRSEDNKSHYIDDVTVYCGPATTAPEIQLANAASIHKDCGYAIDFGNISTDMTSEVAFEILNIGNQPLNINSFNITGDYMVNPSFASSIVAGASQTYTISFAPQSVGAISGDLTINSDDPDEASCTINLSGTGYIGIPEIRVERNDNNNIQNGAAPLAAYNTIFAQTVEGTDSNPKTYYIRNVGDADLDISSLSLSSTEFTITSNPAPKTLRPQEFISFEIVFSPSSPGTKIATLTIINNDDDENPFTFEMRGTGLCTAAAISLSPSNGPIGTIVTISGSNFGTSTTAVISDISVSTEVLSSSMLQIEIPVGANTSKLEITDASGCVASAVFTVYTKETESCDGNSNSIPVGWSDMLISGLFDNTAGSCHYLELFNPTANAINLSSYSIQLSNNKGNANDPFGFTSTKRSLSGTIAAYGTFIVQFGNTGSTCSDCPNISVDLVIQDPAFGVNGIGSDGVDRLVLLNGSTYVDLWANSEYVDSGYVYTRATTSTSPNMTYLNSDWNSQGSADCFGFELPPFFDGPLLTDTILDSSVCNIATVSLIGDSEGYNESDDTRNLEYDWYYFNPNAGTATDWQLISTDEDGLYENYNSNQLTINNTAAVSDFQFYSRVKENDDLCYIASTAKKIDIPSTAWDGTNWIGGVPDINTVVILNGSYSTNINGSFEACSLIINSNPNSSQSEYRLTVNNGNYVAVENKVMVHGELYVDPQGSFIQNSDSGSFKLGTSGVSQHNKMTVPLTDWRDYTYWSSPVEDATVGEALPMSIRRFYYKASNYLDADGDGIDDDANDWIALNDTDVMEPGVGYIASHTNIGFEFGTSFQYNFNGAFNTGTISTPLAYNSINPGNWNLVGNPYPCALDVIEFFDENAAPANPLIEEIIYLWSHHSPASADNVGNDILNYNINDYAIINRSGGIAGASGETPGLYIPSAQSFFVNSLATGNLTFNNVMRLSGEGQNELFFRANKSKSKNKSKPHRLWLNLTTHHGVFNQVLIAYLNQASNDYDGLAYDAEPVYTGFANLYTSIVNEQLQLGIQGKSYESLNEDEVIPLGFNSWIETPTLYMISIAQFEGDFFASHFLLLKDNLTQSLHDLSYSNYEFTSEYGHFENRFEIIFKKDELISEKKDDSISDSLRIIELKNGKVKFIIDSNSEFKTIEIIDLLGRTLYYINTVGGSQTLHLPNIQQGTYIAKVTLQDGRVIAKKAIKPIVL